MVDQSPGAVLGAGTHAQAQQSFVFVRQGSFEERVVGRNVFGFAARIADAGQVCLRQLDHLKSEKNFRFS